MRAFRRSLLPLFVLFLTSLLSAQITFDPPASYPSGWDGQALSVDLNHDGFTDLVQTYRPDEAYLAVMMSNGDGSFRGPFVYNFQYAFSSVAPGDFNGDGKMDLAATGCGLKDCQLRIFYGDNNGAFPTNGLISAGSYSYLTTGDFNNDGKTDLAALVNDTKTAAIFLSTGSGNFAAPRFVNLPVYFENEPGFNCCGNPDRVSDLVAGDWNGDGKMDLAYVDHCGACDVTQEAFFLLWNDGASNFTPQRPTYTSSGDFVGGSGTYRLKSLDIDLDGKSDLYYAFNGCHTPCNGAAILYSDGGGKFTGTGWGGNATSDVVVTDFNNDGLMDIAVHSSNDYNYGQPSGIYIRLGTGRRSFSGTAAEIDSPNPQQGAIGPLVTGYFDANNTKDLAAVEDQSWLIYLNRTATPSGGCAYPSGPGINFCSPDGSNATSPFQLRAAFHPQNYPVARMEYWVDGVKQQNIFNDRVDGTWYISPGTHTLTIVGVDVTGQYWKSSHTVTISNGDVRCARPSTAGVNICSPAPNATVDSPVRIQAAATAPSGTNVTAMRIYVDNIAKYTVNAAAIDTSLDLPAGKHYLAIVEYNSNGTALKSTEYFTVGTVAPGPCLPDSAGAQICSPANGSTVSSPVTFTASARAASGTITAMRVYVDNVAVYTQNNSSASTTQQISTQLSLSAGSHYIVVIGYQSTGGNVKASETITVR